jgi:hypothetical protein
MIREALGYGVWAGLVLLVGMGVYVGVKFGKQDKRWWLLAIAFFLFAIGVAIMQFIDAQT